MGKKLAIEHHLIRPNEVIELLEMMGGKNKDNADGCSFLYYTLCTPKINNPNNEKVICGFTNLKMQNDHFAIFTLEKFWKKYPYKLNETVLCDDGLLGVVTKMEWDCEKSDMKYYISFKIPVDNKWYSSKNIKCKYMEVKGKKLAIKGHPTRGKEVIELLEMMGGINSNEAYGNLPNNWDVSYYIFKDGIISVSEDKILIKKQFEIFTLEEFLEKYPFKVGDKVIDLKSDKIAEVYKMYWSENNSCIYYDIKYPNNCGCQRRLMDLKSMDDNKDVHSISECKTIGQGTYAIKIADGYKFDSIDENGNIIVKSFKPKPIYPKTYEECCKNVLGLMHWEMTVDVPMHYSPLIINFTKLLICRDTYWKIAGEEMGLSKLWEFENPSRHYVFTIENFGGKIQKNAVTARILNRILVFPTEEMRDVFYENFKDLIESCKELL